jgi:hypothetical protein
MPKLLETTRIVGLPKTSAGAAIAGGVSTKLFPTPATVLDRDARANGLLRVVRYILSVANVAAPGAVTLQSAYLLVEVNGTVALRIPLLASGLTAAAEGITCDLVRPLELRIEDVLPLVALTYQPGLLWTIAAEATFSNSGAATTADLTAGPVELEDLLYDSYVYPS